MEWIKCKKRKHLVIYLIFILANAHTDCVSDAESKVAAFGRTESLGTRFSVQTSFE